MGALSLEIVSISIVDDRNVDMLIKSIGQHWQPYRTQWTSFEFANKQTSFSWIYSAKTLVQYVPSRYIFIFSEINTKILPQYRTKPSSLL